jgi:hypothetical protein
VTHDGFELLTCLPDSIEDLICDSWNPLSQVIGWLVRRRLGVRTEA